MDQIFPTTARDVDPAVLLADDLMARRNDSSDRPWVMANMIMSADGAFARNGRSGGLGGPADKAMFHTLRGLADAILVGAGTARAERYRRPGGDETTRAARIDRGQEERPHLALISGTGDFPSDQPFLSGDGPEPTVFVPSAAGTTSRPETSGIRYCTAGTDSVDLADVLLQLGGDGIRLVLCEGGPRLLGDLAAAGLLDQLFITLAPQLVAGSHTGLLAERPELDADLRLMTVVTDEGYLLLNYEVVR